MERDRLETLPNDQKKNYFSPIKHMIWIIYMVEVWFSHLKKFLKGHLVLMEQRN